MLPFSEKFPVPIRYARNGISSCFFMISDHTLTHAQRVGWGLEKGQHWDYELLCALFRSVRVAMAAEENRGGPTQHQQQQSNVGAKTELYSYSASSYTTKSNEGMRLLRSSPASLRWPRRAAVAIACWGRGHGQSFILHKECFNLQRSYLNLSSSVECLWIKSYSKW